MTDHSVIYTILKKKSIVDYLERRGHHPYKTLSGGKLQYLCPFPDHKETKPSFIVWTNDEYEKFYCFGCQRNYNIINLVSALENIPFKQAIELLSDGMEVGVLESINIEIERVIKNADNFVYDLGIADTMISISNLCRSYLEGVNNDSEEQEIIDKLFRSVDADINEFNFDAVSDTLTNLPDILYKRQQMYYAKNR